MEALPAISLVKVVQDGVYLTNCRLRFRVKSISMAVFETSPKKLCIVFGGFNLGKDIVFYDFSLRNRSEGGIISELASDIHLFANIIKEIFDDSYSIDTVIGYSMGGILAYYYAFYYGADNPNLEVITFGSPRPGDENFNNSYDRILKNRTYRYYLEKDWITHIPAFKYWHVGIPCNAERPRTPQNIICPDEEFAAFYVPSESYAFNAKEEWEKTIGGFLPDSPWFIWIWYPIMLLYWLFQRMNLTQNYHSVDSYYEALMS